MLFWSCKSCAIEEVKCFTLCLHNTLLTVRLKYNSREFYLLVWRHATTQELEFSHPCWWKEKKNLLSKLVYLREDYWFQFDIVQDLQLHPSWLIFDSELVNAAYGVRWGSDKCCVCELWGETEGEITGYKKQDTLSQPRQKRQNLAAMFPSACLPLLMEPLTNTCVRNWVHCIFRVVIHICVT